MWLVLKFKVFIIFIFWLYGTVHLQFYVTFCTAAFKLHSQISPLVFYLQMHRENFNGLERIAGFTSQSNQQSEFQRFVPATKDNDGTVFGFQLLFQLGDHNGVVCKRLLHCQQAYLRDSEGVFAKGQRFAIVPLKRSKS